MNDLFPNNSNLNQLGVLFSTAGLREKALEYYEKAFESNPTNSTVAFNLAIEYKNTDPKKFVEMLDNVLRLKPNDPEALFEKGKLQNKNNKGDGTPLIEMAFNTYKEKFDNNQLKEWEFSWFESCANELGKLDLAQIIRESKPKSKVLGLWNDENLTQSKNYEGLIKF